MLILILFVVMNLFLDLCLIIIFLILMIYLDFI